MAIKKIVFLGSKPVGYQCFAHLIEQKEALGLEITGLLTQARKEFGNDHDLFQLAASNNIPVISDLRDMPECDIIYSVQYHKILHNEHIAKARQVAVNLHMAPLPEYRGSNQFSFAIIDNKKEFGASIHVMDAAIDHGDILFQKRFPVPGHCWVGDLYQLTYEASVALFRETISDIATGEYTRISQESLVAKYGSSLHYKHEVEAIKVIDLDWDSEKIDRYIRATSMPGFEPPYCYVNGRKVELLAEPGVNGADTMEL